MQHSRETDVKQLNSFLRGELSAVETYQQCLGKIQDPALLGRMRVLLQSHRSRALLLKQRVRSLGGQPYHTSGAWGSFVQAIEGSSTLGVAAAVALLEEGEDHGNRTYRDNLEKLSTPQRVFIEKVIYPEQLKSHDTLSALQEAV